jgi:hypothetical protein
MAQCADTAAGRRRFVEHLDSRAREEGIRAGVIEPGEDRRQSHLRQGWYWGSQAFAESIPPFLFPHFLRLHFCRATADLLDRQESSIRQRPPRGSELFGLDTLDLFFSTALQLLKIDVVKFRQIRRG